MVSTQLLLSLYMDPITIMIDVSLALGSQRRGGKGPAPALMHAQHTGLISPLSPCGIICWASGASHGTHLQASMLLCSPHVLFPSPPFSRLTHPLQLPPPLRRPRS